MTTKLPTELRQAIEQNPGILRLEDEQTHAVYFVIDEETHRRAMRALQEQEDHAAIRAGTEQMEAGQGRPVAEVDVDLRKEFGFPPRP
jgi:hypothetical protein